MHYTSTVTSKGTITLPAALRRKFGIVEGDKMEISMHGSTITIQPQIGWDEFLTASQKFGEKARKQIASGKKEKLLTNDAINNVVRNVQASRHA